MNDRSRSPDGRPRETAVPPAGALGLLALGYRGLEAWREARGRGWVDERRREWEEAKAAEAAPGRETPG